MKRLLTTIGLLFAPLPVHAVSITRWFDCSAFLFCGSTGNIPQTMTVGIASTIFKLIIPVAVITFMYGGIRMIVSQGGEGKEAGKKAMTYAAIGLALAAIAFLIVQFVINLVRMI